MTQSKILLIINGFDNLSIVNNAFKIGSYLENSGLTPYFLSFSPRGKLRRKFKNCFHSRIFVSAPSFPQNIITLAKLLKKIKFDFVFTQTLRADYSLFIAKMILGKHRRAFHIANRGNYFFLTCEPNYLIKNILFFFSCHLVDFNICCVRHLADKLVSRLKVPSAKVKVIPNGVRLPADINRPTRRERINITFTGQLVKRKNLLFLIKALQMLRSDYHCRLIGSGPEKQNLARYIADHNLEKRIGIIPNQLDVRPFLKQTDIFVLPSLAEGMSLSLLEAMSYGIACIASDIDANREVISHNHDGVLLSLKKSPADLAEKLEKLISDRRLRRRLGDRAKKKIITSFSEEKMLRRFAEFYRRRLIRRWRRNQFHSLA